MNDVMRPSSSGNGGTLFNVFEGPPHAQGTNGVRGGKRKPYQLISLRGETAGEQAARAPLAKAEEQRGFEERLLNPDLLPSFLSKGHCPGDIQVLSRADLRFEVEDEY